MAEAAEGVEMTAPLTPERLAEIRDYLTVREGFAGPASEQMARELLDAYESQAADVGRLRAQRAALYAQVARLTQLATVARQERLPVSADLIFGALKESGSRRTDWREICEACGVNDFDHRPGCPILAEERSLTAGDEVQP